MGGRRGDGARLSFWAVMGGRVGAFSSCLWPCRPHAHTAGHCFLTCFCKTWSLFLGEFVFPVR